MMMLKWDGITIGVGQYHHWKMRMQGGALVVCHVDVDSRMVLSSLTLVSVGLGDAWDMCLGSRWAGLRQMIERMDLHI